MSREYCGVVVSEVSKRCFVLVVKVVVGWVLGEFYLRVVVVWIVFLFFLVMLYEVFSGCFFLIFGVFGFCG